MATIKQFLKILIVIAALAAVVVHHLLVGDDGLAAGAPVGLALPAVDDPLLPHRAGHC